MFLSLIRPSLETLSMEELQRLAHSVPELPLPQAETTDLGIDHDPQ